MAKKKATAKKTTAKKSKKLDNLSQMHGMVEKFEPSTLAQIWGDDGTSKYGTLELDEYEAYLKDLTKSDLGAHAQKIGLIPIDNSKLLKDRLTKEFNRHVAGYRKPASKSRGPLKISQEARKILEEGR